MKIIGYARSVLSFMRGLIQIYNWAAIFWFMDGHFSFNFSLFNLFPNNLDSLEIGTFQEIPASYPPLLGRIFRVLMPLRYMHNGSSKFKLSLFWNLCVLSLNFIIVIPIGYFLKGVNFLFKNYFMRFHIYFYLIVVYRKILSVFFY